MSDCSAAHRIERSTRASYFLNIVLLAVLSLTYSLGSIAAHATTRGRTWCDCCCSAVGAPPPPLAPSYALTMLHVFRFGLLLSSLLALAFATFHNMINPLQAHVWMARTLRYRDAGATCSEDFVRNVRYFVGITSVYAYTLLLLVLGINSSLCVLATRMMSKLRAKGRESRAGQARLSAHTASHTTASHTASQSHMGVGLRSDTYGIGVQMP